MQVTLSAGEMDIEESQPAQPAGQHNLILSGQRRIRKEHKVGLPQAVGVALKKFRETRATHLFLALNQEGDAQGERRIRLKCLRDGGDIRQ